MDIKLDFEPIRNQLDDLNELPLKYSPPLVHLCKMVSRREILKKRVDMLMIVLISLFNPYMGNIS